MIAKDHASQPDMFLPDVPKIAVTVTYHGRARYYARIAGGWNARGNTPDEAIKNVMKIYEQELNKHATN